MKTDLMLLDSYENIESLVAYAYSFSHRANRHLKFIYVYDFNWMHQSYAVSSVSVADLVLNNVESNTKKVYVNAEAKIRSTLDDYLKTHLVEIPFKLHVSKKNGLT